MPSRLIAYSSHAFGKHAVALESNKSENALNKIFLLLRSQTSHDFSQYKPSTVHRRIERRMAVNQIKSMDSYVKFLQEAPFEVDALFRDMLIGVTSFFRDLEAFQMLETKVIPGLFEGKPDGAEIRVWSAGCSTGEEAYSIAILLHERMEVLKKRFKVQVFASDIDSLAVAKARRGTYPASISADITHDRLARYFIPEGGQFRVHNSIRDLVVFSEVDLIKDPPFSRLDLISCRNLLIYLGGELQLRIIPMFHYALKPKGSLFLGTSESVGDFGDLFASMDRKNKLYRRQEDVYDRQRLALNRAVVPVQTAERARVPSKMVVKQPMRELAERELLRHATAGALVNANGDILYVHGRTGVYLELAAGEAGINNILKIAREGLTFDLTMALHKAAATREIVRRPGVRIKTNGHFTTVNLTVRPVPPSQPASASDAQLLMVILDEVPEVLRPEVVTVHTDADACIAELKEELRSREEFLRNSHEELEASAEELRSSNEEMQSVNEELQSTNEELETSQEELQSVNEELLTVNAELETNVKDLARANNDISNLLSGTGIATIFVTTQQRILSFTPATAEIIDLLPSDVGRPLASFVANLKGYESIAADVKSVLDTLVPKEMEVESTKGRIYLLRIQLYRTRDNAIEGAAINFLDVTDLRKATVKISDMQRVEEALRKANDMLRLAVVVRDAHDAITVQDLEGRIIAWNPGAVRMFGWSEAEALAMNVRDRIPQELRESALDKLAQLSRTETLEPYRTRRLTKSGAVVDVSIISSSLVNKAGEMYAIATTERAASMKTT